MIEKVKNGAKLSCTLGSCQSMLCVPISHGSTLQGEFAATITDRKPNVNIMPFGMCTKSSPPVPCTPVFVMDWLLANPKYKIREEITLLNTCILPCMLGGIVKIEDSGQKK
mgnify:CR=1 FL=1